MTAITTWNPLPKRPDLGVGFAERVAPGNSLTPQEVRNLYANQVSSETPVVWADSAAGVVGVLTGIDEFTWRITGTEQLRLTFQRPGKGSGFVVLEFASGASATPERIAFSNRFTDAYMTWIKNVALALAQSTGASIQVEDEGDDA